ncbi:MAG TPA: hypothetical protein VK487_09385 [Candidatus Bathyarchaeia archaeon]|nr:hypothetical protein [Candidatus Bathyarchaeia archaeon]
MGRKRKRKHTSERGLGYHPIVDDSQSRLTSVNDFPRVTKSDIKDFLIPTLKEIGKAVCPPASIPIEVLYQLYKHAGAVKDAGSAVLRGDYKEAAKVIIREGVKEVAGAGIGGTLKPEVTKASDSLEDGIHSGLPIDEQGKQVAGEVSEGTVKGVVEAFTDKVIDKTVDKVDRVVRNERGSSETKDS